MKNKIKSRKRVKMRQMHWKQRADSERRRETQCNAIAKAISRVCCTATCMHEVLFFTSEGNHKHALTLG